MGTSRNAKRSQSLRKIVSRPQVTKVATQEPSITESKSVSTPTESQSSTKLDIVLYDPADLPPVRIDTNTLDESKVVNADDVFNDDKKLLSLKEKVGLTAVTTFTILLVVGFLSGVMQSIIRAQLDKHPALKTSTLLVKLSQCGSLVHRKKKTFVRVTANGVLDDDYLYDCTGELYRYLSRSKRLIHGCVDVTVTDFDATGIFTITTDLYGKLYLFQYDRVLKTFLFLSADERVEYNLRLVDVYTMEV